MPEIDIRDDTELNLKESQLEHFTEPSSNYFPSKSLNFLFYGRTIPPRNWDKFGHNGRKYQSKIELNQGKITQIIKVQGYEF